ncbi:MAG TPA: hypothetical protein VD903_08675, partial [Pseudonocardia sp.]|nr:hypothetical protein [Pseudonocardia sp.]
MTEASNDDLARLLWTAQRTATAVPRHAAPDLDLAAGHAVQAAGMALRVAAGDRVAGRKAGLTSATAQAPMAADAPVTGYLAASTITPAAAEFDCGRLLAPRVEVEIAFVLARPLAGPDLSPSDVLAATEHLAMAFEVVDSRWEGGP